MEIALEPNQNELARLTQSVDTAIGYSENELTHSFEQHLSDEVIPTLSNVLVPLHRKIEKQHILAVPEDRSTTVIHYTSLHTIVSILQSRSMFRQDVQETTDAGVASSNAATLRLYDSAHFNDPAEGNYLGSILPDEHSWVKNADHSHAYAVSFINHNGKNEQDDLVFWRTYGGEGEGCSITLNVPSHHLRRVIYGADDAADTLQALTPVLDVLQPLATNWQDEVIQKLRQSFWESLARIRYLYKRKEYEYEKEWRIVVAKSDVDVRHIGFDYRRHQNASSHLRHFVTQEDLVIEQMLGSGSVVTVGPRVTDPEDLCQSLEILKRRAGLNDLRITRSGIDPYRLL